jgi:hypothetical protein
MKPFRALMFLCVVPLFSNAAAISGTMTASFKDFSSFGVPRVNLKLSLQCSLVCTSTAPTLHYGVGGLVNAYFASAPMESAGYVSVGFATAVDPTGNSETVSEAFSAGSTFYVEAKSATCACGGHVGEGGYIDLKSTLVTIPAWLSAPSTLKASNDSFISVNAKLRGTETVEVKLSGAGLNQTKTFTAQELGSQNAASVSFTPTAAGMLTATSILHPSEVAHTVMMTVAASTSSGAGGGSASGAGGGNGGGGAPQGGCSTTLFPGLMCLMLLKKSRQNFGIK